MWYGFDPGGEFGIAKLRDDGTFESKLSPSIDATLAFVDNDCRGIGIDSVLWWSKSKGGGRRADKLVRDACTQGGGKGGTVSPINSLQGAMFVPAYLVIRALRERQPSLRVTEAHPKALLHAMNLPVWRRGQSGTFDGTWQIIAERFGLRGPTPSHGA